MRREGTYRAACLGALLACAAFSGCTLDFGGLVAKTGSGGTGIGGSAGLGGLGGAGGAAGSDDDGGEGDSNAGAAGSGGASGASGTGGDGGQGGSAVDADIGDTGGAGAQGDASTDAATDRRSDASADVQSEAGFDCAAVNGTVFQGHCYYPSPTPTSWDVAKMTSCAAPSHLVVITTPAEQSVVAAILAGKQRWIGLRKDPGPPNQEARFYWVTKEAVTFKIWDSYETGLPEPNFTGDCVRLQPSDNWGDTNCADAHAAVCEYE